MKEEYFEIEGYEEYQKISELYDEEVPPVEETPSLQQSSKSASQQQHTSDELFAMQPQDNHLDDVMLRKLLKKFQMSFLYPFFKAYDITYRSLRYISVDDINTVIRSVGHRAEFREKLFTWRRKRYRTNDVIIEHEKVVQNPATSNIPNNTQTLSNSHQHSMKKEKRPVSCTDFNEQQSNGGGESTTNIQDLVTPMKHESSNFDTSSLQDMMNDLPLEIEMDGMVAMRPRLETIVNLQETRIGSLLNLEELVDESVFGPIMKAFYNKNGYLERKHRDELIQTIVDYVIVKDIKLHCSDFGKIVDMIVNIFPTEEEARDYYFINRKGKRNPMGRLYTKYYNTLKRMRVRDIHQEFTQDTTTYYLQSGTLADDAMLTKEPPAATSSKTSLTTTLIMEPTNAINANDVNNISNSCSSSNSTIISNGGNKNNINNDNTQIELLEDEFQELIQLDDTSVSAIKNFLRCQGLNWDDVKTMWSKTYLSRQEDVEHSTIKDVLQQWPKYLNARGMELFDIDFRLKFSRNKANILQRKWSQFVRKICQYYQTNIKDEMCKGLFALWKSKPGKDTEDYIITVLLNSIMIPMARYRDALGNRRKVSIVEAVDLFAVRVNHLEELDQKREEFAIKFGDIHTDFTPLIVVVGDNNINIHEIYVHFDVALYEMPDFISALDCCMKIYRVLNLPFPTSNEYVWTFFQRHFYEILLPDDLKCPSMSSLITSLKF